jgi:hypothetical protein
MIQQTFYCKIFYIISVLDYTLTFQDIFVKSHLLYTYSLNSITAHELRIIVFRINRIGFGR